jgi:hypothetical protein
VRRAVVGSDDRPATPAELARMRLLVEGALDAGACGVSSGLEYAPGAFASREELVHLCRAAAARGLAYATHMRNEDDRLLESIDEAIAVATAAGCALQISHLKTQGRRNWPKIDQALARVEAARAVTAELAAPAATMEPVLFLVRAALDRLVRALVADGRADLGVAASRPNHTPNPAVRELELAADAIVCAVPATHKWAGRERISLQQFLATPMVVRDPSSNARWTVDAVLAERGLTAAEPLVEAPTPRAAITEARLRNAPVLLSRHILAQTDYTVLRIEDLAFPRSYVLVTPAYGEPTGAVRDLVDRIRHAVRVWLR